MLENLNFASFFSVAPSRSSIFATRQLLEFRFLNCLNHTFPLIISWVAFVTDEMVESEISENAKWRKLSGRLVQGRATWWVSHRTAACSLFTFWCDLFFFLSSLATRTKTREKLFPSLTSEGCFREKLRRMKSEEKFKIQTMNRFEQSCTVKQCPRVNHEMFCN